MGALRLLVVRRSLASVLADVTVAISFLSILVLASGCAQRADGSFVTIADDTQVLTKNQEGLTPVEQRQLERVRRYASMRVQGAGVGAVLGAVTGALAFGGNRGAGAAGGAVAGAALGYLAGAYVANLNETAEDRRDDLNVQVDAARRAVDETERAVADNREIVSAERSRIERLNRDYRAGDITQEQYRDQIANLETKILIVNESLRAAENDVAAMDSTIQQQQAQSVDPKPLAEQRARMEEEVRVLREERERLATAVASIPPEIGAPAA